VSLVGLSLAVRMRMARQEARGVSLATLCDAALAETLPGISVGQPAGIGSHAFAGGAIGSEVEMLTPQHFRVTATALFDGKSRSVVADVVRDTAGTRVVHWQRLAG
jgi:hypothetical protein